MSEQQKMRVESFNLDHTKVRAPFVRLADHKVLPKGDVLVKYDIRFKQPNQDHLEMPTIHSLEHLIAESLRVYSDRVIDFSPMGCQTGFYLILSGDPDYNEVLDLIENAVKSVLSASEVPAANVVQCGWGASHSLTGAVAAAREFLEARNDWHLVT